MLLYLWCSSLSVVIAYPDRSTLQIVRQLLDRVKDIDEVHIVEAKLLQDPSETTFSDDLRSPRLIITTISKSISFRMMFH